MATGSGKTRILGVVLGLTGVLLITVPWLIFPVCGVGRFAPPPGQPIGHHGCHGTLYAETVIGIITAVAGLVAAAWPRRRIALASSVAGLILAVAAAAVPLGVVGVCKMSTMPCRLGTVPALVTVAVLMGVVSAVGLLSSMKDR